MALPSFPQLYKMFHWFLNSWIQQQPYAQLEHHHLGTSNHLTHHAAESLNLLLGRCLISTC